MVHLMNDNHPLSGVTVLVVEDEKRIEVGASDGPKKRLRSTTEKVGSD